MAEAHLVVTLGLSPQWLLHDEDDEDDRQEAENRSPSKGPVPVAVEGDGETAADDIPETAETETIRVKTCSSGNA